MTQATPEERVRALGLQLPAAPVPAADYALWTAHGGRVYISGQLPRVGNDVAVTGRVGAETPLAQGCHAAHLCTLRALAVLREALGSLDAVEQILKLQVFVQSAPDFHDHSAVADAASALLVQVFGLAGRPARTAVGVYQLPRNASVELDMVVAAVSVAAASSSKESFHASSH